MVDDGGGDGSEAKEAVLLRRTSGKAVIWWYLEGQCGKGTVVLRGTSCNGRRGSVKLETMDRQNKAINISQSFFTNF